VIAPYGSWRSPLDAAAVAAGGVGLSSPAWGDDGSIWWLERRPQDQGRSTLVRDGADVTPAGVNVRTRVHEYGGGAWLLHGETAFYSEYADQRLYRLDPGAEPVAITPESDAAVRYADARATADGARLVCVRETHTDGPPANEIVVLPADGVGDPVVLASGRDFYSFPRISPDGTTLAYTCWDHPNMPWDGSELWVAPLDPPEAGERVAGGPGESIWQPEWDPDGRLHWVSDRTGWWQLYREGEQLTAEDGAEVGYPQWLFGGSTYAFLADGTIAAIRTRDGEESLCLVRDGRLDEVGLPYTQYGSFPALHARGDELLFVAGSPEAEPALIRWSAEAGATVVRAPGEAPAAGLISRPRRLDFATSGGATAHAFFYPPANPDYAGPAGERPPLIVQIHGGPTGHSPPSCDTEILYWTSRGIGVVDVNYRGSSGYGRAYRDALQGEWGVADTDDCIAAARALVEAGEVDGDRLAIHGGSAGGYTTLCALVFHDLFAAGASYYGVADAETLAHDTHKFESRYLDGLIGPYPETADLWRARSPIHFADRLNAAVILFQGLEDEVVPPAQAETMVAALAANGVPHAYRAFEGEQHGFRRAETIVASLEAELSFYAQIFGFEPAGAIEPVEIVR
jgi:dipeptidyl aminopeptidase/acylaminoacyl peptidase